MARWKLIEEKFKKCSRDITFQEATTLLEHYGFEIDHKGKTSGSRVRFISTEHGVVLLHRPHPQKELKEYVIRDLRYFFEQEGFWNE